MGNAGSILKGTPAFGYIPLAQQVTAADIVGSKGRWVGPWVDVNAAFVAHLGASGISAQKLCKALYRKAHFPVGGALNDSTATVTMTLQGRMGPNDPDIVTVDSRVVNATNNATVLAQSDGTATGAANVRSSQTVDSLALYPQMRAVFTAFADSGDGLKDRFRTWPYANGATFEDYCPVGVTAAATEGIQVALPASEPPAGGYPVLVIVKANGVAGAATTAYGTNGSIVAGGANADLIEPTGNDPVRLAWDGLSQGYAVVSVLVPGIADTVRTGLSAWRRNSEIDYALGTVHDPRKDIAWAMQWVRTSGHRDFDLNPQAVTLCGEYDAATLVLWHVFGDSDASNGSSTTLSLRADEMPNAVVVRSPEVDWTMPANALRCPLLDAARTAVATTIGSANLTDRSILSPVRQLTLDARTNKPVDAIGRVPIYVIVDGSPTLVDLLTTDTLVGAYVPGAAWAGISTSETGFYAPNSTLALGTQTVQFDDMHCYALMYAIRDFIAHWNLGDVPLRQSHLHVQTAANVPDAPILASLVNSSGSGSDTAANILALQWVARLQSLTLPSKGAQAVFDVGLLL